MKLHGMLGLMREDKTPLLKPSILYTHHPVETCGEHMHMFIPPTMKRLATEQTIENFTTKDDGGDEDITKDDETSHPDDIEMTHKEDVPDSLHGGNTSNDKRTTDLANRQGTDGENTIEDSDSEVEDRKKDDPTQELPIRESEIEETQESESYKTEDKIVHKSQELSSAPKEGRELPPLNENVTESEVQTEEEESDTETSTTSNDSETEELPEGKMVTKDNEEGTPSSSNEESDNNVTGSEDSNEDITTEWQRRPPDK